MLFIQWVGNHQKLSLPLGGSGPHVGLRHVSLSPPMTTLQSASRSVQSFYAGLPNVTNRYTDIQRYRVRR